MHLKKKTNRPKKSGEAGTWKREIPITDREEEDRRVMAGMLTSHVFTKLKKSLSGLSPINIVSNLENFNHNPSKSPNSAEKHPIFLCVVRFFRVSNVVRVKVRANVFM